MIINVFGFFIACFSPHLLHQDKNSQSSRALPAVALVKDGGRTLPAAALSKDGGQEVLYHLTSDF